MSTLIPHDVLRRINVIMEADNDVKYVDVYRKWCIDGQYDKDNAVCDHRAHIIAVNEIERLHTDRRDELNILDVGAGTGKVADQLRRCGFIRCDAVDPCHEMLNRAREKHLYRDYYCTVFDGRKLNIPEDSYDVLVCVAVLCAGHLPADALYEMIRLVKPGGHIIIVGSGTNWRKLPEYSEKMAALIIDFKKKGKVQVIKQEFAPNYMYANTIIKTDDGIVIVLRKF